MTADAGVSVGQTLPQDVGWQRLHAVQRAQGMEPGQRPAVLRCQVLEQRDGRLVLPLYELLLGHVALPAVGAVQRGNEARGVEPVEARDGPRLLIDRVDAVDAALVV